MLTAYIQAAMRHAHYEIIENGDEPFYAEIPDLQGVWALGPTLEAARDELQEVVEDWILVRFHQGLQVPVLDGIDINAKATA